MNLMDEVCLSRASCDIIGFNIFGFVTVCVCNFLLVLRLHKIPVAEP